MASIAHQPSKDLDTATAANVLLSAVGQSFMRIRASMAETSRKLSRSCENIRLSSQAKGAQ